MRLGDDGPGVAARERQIVTTAIPMREQHIHVVTVVVDVV